MTAIIHVVATLTARPGREAALQNALTAVLDAVRAESGCLRYDLHHDRDDPARFVMLESWADAEALQAHSDGPAFARLAAQFDALLVTSPDLRRLRRLA